MNMIRGSRISNIWKSVESAGLKIRVWSYYSQGSQGRRHGERLKVMEWSSRITKVFPGARHGAASMLLARITDMVHTFSINGYSANLRDQVPLTSIYLRLGRYVSHVLRSSRFFQFSYYVFFFFHGEIESKLVGLKIFSLMIVFPICQRIIWIVVFAAGFPPIKLVYNKKRKIRLTF